jgi:quercetin dioxygenase-like cupin family protein
MSTSNKPETNRGLPEVTAYVTGHDKSTGKAIIQESRPGIWSSIDSASMAFNVVYTTSAFPASLNDSDDIKAHDHVIASGQLGLVNPNGTVLRIVDFAPGYESMMHRTRSLDYGIVLEGTVELILDSGVTQRLTRGDVVVQRGTNHAWRNASKTEWVRMIYCLQDCQEVKIGGNVLAEKLELERKE